MKAADLVGVWRLQEFSVEARDAKSRPFGERPNGRLHLFENGELLVALFAQGRAFFASDDIGSSAPTEGAEAFRSAISYFGRWRFLPEEAALLTEVEGSLFPNWVGTVQKRFVEFPNSEQLTLSSPPTLWGGQEQRAVLRWSRVR